MAYKLLWYSIPCLHDKSNGAAIHSKFMLEVLVKSGVEVKVLNATVADDPAYLSVFDPLKNNTSVNQDQDWYQFTEKGIEYFLVKTTGNTEPTITCADQGKIFNIYTQLLEAFQPDAVMGYSGDCFSVMMRHEAAVRGIPSVYMLCNGLHRNFAFFDCDLVVTPSKATAAVYNTTPEIKVRPIGQFIDPEACVSKPGDRIFVTMINPGLHKGLSIFVRLVDIFKEKRPDLRFLIIQNGNNLSGNVQSLHYADGTPYVNQENSDSLLKNLSLGEFTNDISKVYAASKVVVMPSLWHEAWGCVATEAIMNGIPVLATADGGLPEAVGEGGICVSAPEESRKDYSRIPTDEEMQPFVEALERLLDEDWSERCARAAAENSPERSAERLLSFLKPVMSKGRRNKNVFAKSTYFNRAVMDARRKERSTDKAK